MRSRRLFAVLLVIAPLLLGACASKKGSVAWKPGDTIICPHCGREFALPEKLGK
jgi:hypothetical protein